MTRDSLNFGIKKRLQAILADDNTLSLDFVGFYTDWFQNLIKLAKQRKLAEQALEPQAKNKQSGGENAA